MSKTPTTAIGKLATTLSLIGLLFFFSASARVASAQDAPPNGADNNQAPADQSTARPPGDQAQSPAPQGSDQQMSNGRQSAPNYPANNVPADDPANTASDQNDPPSKAARVSLLEGSVSLQPGGEGDWGNAQRNRPVTVGDKIWVDKNSRAEIQSGAATFHLGMMTAFSFLNLDGNTTQVRVAEGSVNFRVREMREGDIYEIDTPNVAFNVKQAGAFRVDVAENGDGTRITAIRGEGEVTVAGQTYIVHTGERGEFIGTDNNIQYVAHGASPPDSLDRWANDRDLREDNSKSSKYVNPDVPGAADLDDNGTWSEQPDVGSVWTPNNVGPDWAPYSDGAWNYVGPWGWSWVGYEPWGFAPYHYGRWGIYGGRWGWAPGPFWARPYYGPAFVGFLGGGFGVGVGFGAGFGFGVGVGWFPLGFGEPFHPWYHAGFGYVRNINIHNTVIRNTTVINNRNFNYSYAHNTRAVTAASRNTFVNGERVNRGAAHITEASLRNTHITNGAGFSPTRSSFTGASRTGNVARPSASVQNRAVVARNTPAPGASHAPVNSANTSRPGVPLGNRTAVANNNTMRSNQAAQNRAATATRTWSAQGNVTDRGTSPQGAGHNVSNNGAVSRPTQSDRPQWARGSSTSGSNGQRTYNSAGATYGRSPNASLGNRSGVPQRSNSAPGRMNSAPAPRTYSTPSRTSAPSAPHSGGGSAPHASGGGAPHGGGGGGGSHGGGGGGSHH